ncbi:transposon TX1 [Tanacetum coccineum]|uniref:Transposon TX1 n=1 Tax=Tanacetum coccineum TaxID=301880 RepID=A0ABQ5E730_9ASTR
MYVREKTSFNNFESVRARHDRNRGQYNGKHLGTNYIGGKRNSTISFMFFNLPEEWGMGKLWMVFKKYGMVFDMFMAQRRLRNGMRYGFVRYKAVNDVENLLRQLQQIKIGVKWLRVLEGNQNMIYGRVNIHTTTKGLIRENLTVKVKGKTHEVCVVEEVRDINMVDVHGKSIRGQEVNVKGEAHKKGDSDMEVDDEDDEDDGESNSEEGEQSDEEGEFRLRDDDDGKVGITMVSGSRGLFKKEAVAEVKSDYGENNGWEDGLILKNKESSEMSGSSGPSLKKNSQGTYVSKCKDSTNNNDKCENEVRNMKEKEKEGNEVNERDNVRNNREKREVSPSSSVDSGGARMKKKRKANEGMYFEGDEVVIEFNQGKTNEEQSAIKKKIAVNSKWNVNMEQVKEIGEMVGVSWLLADKEKKETVQECERRVVGGDEIISINVRGMEDNEKKGWIRSIIKDEKPDVIGLQETKSGVVDDIWIEDLWGGKGYGYSQLHAVGSSGGIILIWDSRVFECKEAIGDERFIAVKGSWKGENEEVFLVWGSKETTETLRCEAMRWELEAEKRTLTDSERLTWLEARKRWEENERKYCHMLRQKTRIRWDAEGDENSKVFTPL